MSETRNRILVIGVGPVFVIVRRRNSVRVAAPPPTGPPVTTDKFGEADAFVPHNSDTATVGLTITGEARSCGPGEPSIAVSSDPATGDASGRTSAKSEALLPVSSGGPTWPAAVVAS